MPIIMATIGIYYMWRLEDTLYDTVQLSVHSIGAHAASMAEESLSETIHELQHAAKTPLLQDAQKNKKELFSYLRGLMESREWHDMLIVDTKGDAITINGLQLNIAQRDYFKKALTGVANSSPLIDKSKYINYVIAHSTPIFNENNQVAGVLVALEDVKKTNFFEGIALRAKLDCEFFFVDAHGNWIHRGIVNTHSFWDKLFSENNLPSQENINSFIENHEKSATPLLVDGKSSFITMNAVGKTGWLVVGITPSHAVTTHVNSMITFSLIFVSCMLIVLFCCMVYLFKVGQAFTRYKNFSLAVANTNGIFYFYVDDDGFVHSANDYFYEQLSWKQGQTPMQLFDYVDGLSLDQLQTYLQTRSPFVLTMVPPNGEKFHIQCTIMPHVREGKMHLLLGTDISVYKAHTEMDIIKAQHDELQQIINALPNSLMVHSPEGLRLANKTALDILGVKNIEDMRTGILCGMDATTFALQVQMVAKVLKDGLPQTSTFNFLDANGKEYVFQNVQSPVFDDDNNVKYAVNLCIDITDTLRLQKQLEDELQRLHEILDSSPSGFFYTHNSMVEYCNPAIQDMFGLEVGKPVPIDKLNITDQVKYIRENVENGINVYDMPMSIMDTNSRERHLSITTLGTTWYGKWYNMIWAHDVTTIHNVQTELILAKDAAEAAARAKSNFLATMSHEIRTPMNAVLGFLQVFDKSNLHQTQLAYIEKITISAKGLLRIINDILDFSKIEANKMDLEYTPFNLFSNIDAIYSIMHFTAQEKGLTFKRTITPELPSYIMGDGERLNQVLLNLLSNAIKFTESGSVTLHVGIKERQDHSRFVLECSVSDTGIGLSQEQAASLFKPFTQADTSTSRRFGGTGLGLVISQRIIQLMGGDITLHSELGKGSTFTCLIPMRAANQEEVLAIQGTNTTIVEQPQASQEQNLLDSIKGKSVLVVEDNLINQEIAGAMLEEYELELDFAENGLEAVEAVKKKNYALIFMDLQMPIMNGLDATKNIRAMADTFPYLSDVPIIAMTANVMHEDRQSCQDVGMNDHVGKPIDAIMLKRALITWLAKSPQ